MLELAEATQDRAAAQMTAMACVLDANAVSKWDAVIRLAARAAEGYDGDYRVHVAALFAGRFDEAYGARGTRTGTTRKSRGVALPGQAATRPVGTTKPRHPRAEDQVDRFDVPRNAP